jgi:hypothetical protein
MSGWLEIHRGDAPLVEIVADSANQRSQAGAARADVLPFPIEQPGAQGLEHPGAPVGTGAATEADDHLIAADVQGRPDQVAGAPAGGQHRVQPAVRQPA